MLYILYRCESARKIVERVFGILKKRFRYLKLPMLTQNITDIHNIIRSCFIMHNMNILDQGRFDLGHLQNDWIDRGPDVSKARCALYDATNGRTFLFNFKAYVIEDKTDFSLIGSQAVHPDFCDTSKEARPTETSVSWSARDNAPERVSLQTSTRGLSGLYARPSNFLASSD